MTRRWGALAVAVVLLMATAGCGGSRPAPAAGRVDAEPSMEYPLPSDPPTPSPTPSPSPSPSKKATPKPKPSRTLKPTSKGADTGGIKPPTTNDGTPTHAAGTFTLAPGGTDEVGTGSLLVQYRVEVEDGIPWGTIPAWTPARFAATVDQILADPRGWIASAAAPITDPTQKHVPANASWRFQR